MALYKIECPECAAEFEEDIELVGEFFECPDCGVELEITSLNPLEVDLLPPTEEDHGE